MAEIRRLTRRSGSLQVTIPRRWIRELGLTRGDYVLIEREGEGLIVIRPLWKETTSASRTAQHSA